MSASGWEIGWLVVEDVCYQTMRRQRRWSLGTGSEVLTTPLEYLGTTMLVLLK